MLTKEEYFRIIDDLATDELSGWAKYDETMEKFEDEEDRKIIEKIAEDELKHLEKLRYISLRHNLPEPTAIRALEKASGLIESEVEEEKHSEDKHSAYPTHLEEKKETEEKRYLSSMIK